MLQLYLLILLSENVLAITSSKDEGYKSNENEIFMKLIINYLKYLLF